MPPVLEYRIYEDSSIGKSVTNAITIEIERLRALALASTSKAEGELQRTEYELNMNGGLLNLVQV